MDFILGEAGNYLRRAPKRADVRSIWVGLRPLVKHQDDQDTKTLSREHTVAISRSGLVTVTGGKWTTYRVMAEDVLALASRPAYSMYCPHAPRSGPAWWVRRRPRLPLLP